MSLGEFDIIARYFKAHFPKQADVLLGIGDDAAICTVPPDKQLVSAIDTMVSGVHFPAETRPEDIGYKVLAVNLSDIAAMGADPAWILLALTCPTVDETWLAGFSQGLRELAQVAQVSLIGGDTTQGHLTVTITVIGWVDKQQALCRQGAQVGDKIYVTGTLGDAALGLQSIQGKRVLPTAAKQWVEARLNRPTPRLHEGKQLSGIAHSAIDISDGLLADLGHILTASQVGASIQLQHLPLSSVVRNNVPLEMAYNMALTGGDDYELCFTISPSQEQALHTRLPTNITCIGTIEAEPGIRCYTSEGERFILSQTGYQHFKH